MKILRKGTAHMVKAWFTTCDTCESELRIIEGDPLAGETCYNCDASQYYIRYICPVCGERKTAWTRSSFGVEANAEYKNIILNKEDREEIEKFKDLENRKGLTDEDVIHLSNRCRV